MAPAVAPEWRRIRSPTRKGRALSSTVPAMRLPIVCWAARPKSTAVSGTTDRERLRLQPGDAECDQDGERDREEANQEAERAGRAGVEALEEDRADGAADVARERPAQDHERDHAGDADRHVDAEQVHAVLVGERGPPRRAAG